MAHSEIHKIAFENVNSSIFRTHAPIISNTLSGHLLIMELWQNFGGAFRVDSAHKPLGQNKFIITLTGDIPQNQHIDKDAYAIVACHEMGHVLGGAPLQSKGLSKWSSVEGQADYFATNQCMWRYVRDVPSPHKVQDFDKKIVDLCEESYQDQPVHYLKKDSIQVNNTLERYPSNQCRIDTMMAGVLNQARPACWFADYGITQRIRGRY